MKLKNRIIFPAMGTKMPSEDKFVTDQLIDYHAARAAGGTSLNIVEVASVYQKSAPKAFLSIAEDKYIPKMKELSDAIHKSGGKSGLQLWLGGMAVGSDNTAMMVIPSDTPVPGSTYVIPAASEETLQECVKAFGQAARRAVEAGFDTMEFHAGHGYTAHSFLSPAVNKRDDQYGGSLENRARFALECIKAIRKNIPADMPLFMRTDAHDDYWEDGLTIQEIIQFCNWAGQAGVDVLDVSRGNFSSGALKYEVPSIDLPKGFNVDNASQIRRETGMLTIAVGRINEPAQAEEILFSDKADMVIVGRGQLADPEFCNKAKRGEEDRIVRCVACNQGCFDGFVYPHMPHITCMRNPGLGREAEYELQDAKTKKKVLVVGGGMAGLEAAITLKRRGHEAIICEAAAVLGGQFLLAGVAPRKGEMSDAAQWMGGEALKEGVQIRLETPVTKDLIDEIQPDEIVFALGAKPMDLKVPGSDLPHIINSHELLQRKETLSGEVVIIGGGLVGLEAAEFLVKKASKITVVEMLDEIGGDIGPIRKISVLEGIYGAGISVVTGSKCLEVNETRVKVETKGVVSEIKADTVVVAIGSRSVVFDELSSHCDTKGIPYHVIGDALKARRVLDATREAGEVARAI